MVDPWVETRRLAALGRLLPSLLHQLSTPLASIALRAESLELAAREGGAAGERTGRYLQAIVTESGRCQELLALARVFARRGADEDADVDVNVLCREAARLVVHEAMRRQVEVTLDLDESLPRARGSEPRLRQAVLALVLNALDSTPSPGRAVVSTRREAPGVAVFAADAERGTDAASDDERAARSIAEAHGGSLGREASPAGSRLALRLPAAERGNAGPA